jgi:hypothetical protein
MRGRQRLVIYPEYVVILIFNRSYLTFNIFNSSSINFGSNAELPDSLKLRSQVYRIEHRVITASLSEGLSVHEMIFSERFSELLSAIANARL